MRNTFEAFAKALWNRGGQDRWVSGWALAAAAGVLGWMLQQTNGTLATNTITALTLALALVGLAVAAPNLRFLERFGEGPIIAIVAVALAYQLPLQFLAPPGIYLRQFEWTSHHQRATWAVLLCGAMLAVRPALGRLALPLLLGAHFSLGVWLIKASPEPIIDVFVWHKAAIEAISHGTSPWSISIPNIYGTTIWYVEGWADQSRVYVGFPYPPLSLLWSWLADAVSGDYRYGNLVAMTLAGGFLSYARPGRLGPAAAMLLLFTPRGMFVLEQGWTEAMVVCFLAALVFAACRVPRLLPWVFGLTLAVKQYFVLLIPLAFAQLGGPDVKDRTRLIVRSVTLAALITVPFFLWDPNGFLRSVVVFQGKQPFRVEALSYVAWTAKEGHPVLPLWFSFVMVPVAWAVGLWRAPRTPAGMMGATALLFALFFAFAKQAFCNYYYLVLGCVCCALAVLAPGEPMAGAGPSPAGVGPGSAGTPGSPSPG